MKVFIKIKSANKYINFLLLVFGDAFIKKGWFFIYVYTPLEIMRYKKLLLKTKGEDK